jgi:hypothetical protein
MINNGSLHYDHDRDGTHTELSGCEAKIRSNPYETHVAIRYENKKLSVGIVVMITCLKNRLYCVLLGYMRVVYV